MRYKYNGSVYTDQRLQCPLPVLTKSFVLPQRKALNAKMSTFFDLMTMEGNRGWKPLYFSSDEPKKE